MDADKSVREIRTGNRGLEVQSCVFGRISRNFYPRDLGHAGPSGWETHGGYSHGLLSPCQISGCDVQGLDLRVPGVLLFYLLDYY